MVRSDIEVLGTVQRRRKRLVGRLVLHDVQRLVAHSGEVRLGNLGDLSYAYAD